MAMKQFVAVMVCTLLAAIAFSSAVFAAAVDPQAVHDLAFGESDDKLKAIASLAASGDPDALMLLQALRDGDVQTAGENQILLIKGEAATDLVTGKAVTPLPESRDDIVINNRVRKGLELAIAAFKLADPNRGARLAAVKQLQGGADESALPAIERAMSKENDPEIRELLSLTHASVQLPAPTGPRAWRRSARLPTVTIRRPRRCSWAYWSAKGRPSPSPTPKFEPRRRNRFVPSRVSSRRARWSGASSAASASAASYCSRRSG